MLTPRILTVVSLTALWAGSCGKFDKDDDFVLRAPYSKPTALEIDDYKDLLGFALVGNLPKTCGF